MSPKYERMVALRCTEIDPHRVIAEVIGRGGREFTAPSFSGALGQFGLVLDTERRTSSAGDEP